MPARKRRNIANAIENAKNEHDKYISIGTRIKTDSSLYRKMLVAMNKAKVPTKSEYIKRALEFMIEFDLMRKDI